MINSYVLSQDFQNIASNIYCCCATLSTQINHLANVINPNQDFWFWVNRSGPLISIATVLIGVFGTHYFSKKREQNKIDKEEQSKEKDKNVKINGALIALEVVRINLLLLKTEFLIPYQEQVKNFYNHPHNQSVKQEWKEGKYDMIVRDQSHPKMNYFLYTEVLNFISLKRAPYLIGFFALQNSLDMVNELLTKRNEFLKGNNNWNSVIKYEITHKYFSSEFQLVDDCLGYILLCKKYLKEYAESFLPGYNISEVSLSTNNVNMPDLEKSEHLKRFDELIQKAVFSDDKSGIGKN